MEISLELIKEGFRLNIYRMEGTRRGLGKRKNYTAIHFQLNNSANPALGWMTFRVTLWMWIERKNKAFTSSHPPCTTTPQINQWTQDTNRGRGMTLEKVSLLTETIPGGGWGLRAVCQSHDQPLSIRPFFMKGDLHSTSQHPPQKYNVLIANIKVLTERNS